MTTSGHKRAAFIAAALFNGLAISLVMPLMGLFLIDAVGASPMEMGIFLAIQMAAGVVVSTRVARWSDNGLPRKRIMIVGLQFLVATLIVFSLSRNYWVVLAAAVLLMSGSAPVMSQIYSLGREYCDQNDVRDTSVFISSMRAGFAVAFVIGPPMAFLIKAQYGFGPAFIAGMVAAEVMALVVWMLPETTVEHSAEQENARKVQWFQDKAVVLLLTSLLFCFIANTLFITVIPLYLTKELFLSAQWAGYLLGLAALLEIPLMVFAGAFGARLGYKRLLLGGVSSGVVLFIGMLVLTNIYQLLGLQLFNALFVATTQTMGMLLMQNLMKHQLGLANTLFSNVFIAAMLISNLLIGVIAQWFSYYHVFVAGLLMMLLALFALIWVRGSHDPEAAT